MAYQNPYCVEKHVHRELTELTALLGVDVKVEAAERLQTAKDEADEAWYADPVAIELSKLQDAKDQHDAQRRALTAAIAVEERKSRDATRTGAYADLRSAELRLTELNAELSFSNGHGMTLSGNYDRLSRKAIRAHDDVHRKMASKVRQQCESEYAEKMAELLELLRGQPDVMALVIDIAVVDAIHVNFLP